MLKARRCGQPATRRARDFPSDPAGIEQTPIRTGLSRRCFGPGCDRRRALPSRHDVAHVVVAAVGAPIQVERVAMAAAHEARDPLCLGLRQIDLFRTTTLLCDHGGSHPAIAPPVHQ